MEPDEFPATRCNNLEDDMEMSMKRHVVLRPRSVVDSPAGSATDGVSPSLWASLEHPSRKLIWNAYNKISRIEIRSSWPCSGP
jgi:hypothetical protein